MHLQKNSQQPQDADATDIYTFRREEGLWYIDLPDYLEKGVSKTDLQMAEGAHKFLDWLANGSKKLRLYLSTLPREGAAMLELVEHCDAPRGGAVYLFVPGGEQLSGKLFWICDLALFVFGDMPDRIYVQRLPAKVKQVVYPQNEGSLPTEQKPVYHRAHNPASLHYNKIG